MSKYLLLLISCTFISFNSFGQTNVSGNVSGTWTKANSPYILTGDATVPGGQTLTIQPGVVVQSPSHFIDLRVEGTMLAQGTSADSIHFRGVATSSTSHGGTIFFLAGSSASVMDYVIVERMGDTNYEGAAIYISQGEIPTIQNTAIRFSEKDDFHVWVGGARKFSNMKAVVGVDRGTGGYNAIMPKLGYGSTYRLLQDVSVAGGQMLTIQPGVTIELPSHFIDLLVDGTLMAQGTAVDSIRFRGVASSSTSHGGTVFFRAGSSASVMDNVIVERMGDTNYEGAAIYISQGETPTIHNTAIRFSEKDDFHVWAGGARKFSNVKAVVGVDRGTGSFNSIMPKLGYDSPYRLLEDITVAGGQVLTIQPGVTVEFPLFHRDLFVDGTLLAQGTPSDSIRFVGKSNPGSSSSTHGGAILFNVGSSASVMDHVIVERMGDISYKGYAIYVETGETPTIQNICIRYSERDDFNIWAGGARKFSNVKAVVGISRGTGNFNAIMPKLGYSSPYRLLEDITVAGGQTLTIQPGVTVEFPIFHRDLFVDGTLLAQGTPSDSIRFVGKPNPGSSSSTHGGAILFNVGSSASVMDHVIVERMGDVSYKGYAIFLESNCTIKNTTVKNSEHTGIYIKQGQYIFNNCSIYANAVYGVFNASTSATDIADARSCYWGTQTGPYHHTLNPSGTGNRVSDKVLFNPWLTSPPSNCIPITIKSGNWNDPTVWLCGQVPSSSDPVVLRHVVNVPGSYTARVSQVAYEAGGSLSMSTNGKLKLGN